MVKSPLELKFSFNHTRLKLKSSPISVFEKVYNEESFSFMYESLEHTGRGRYSFLGGKPFILFKSKDTAIEIERMGETQIIKGNPLYILRKILSKFDIYPALKGFCGGAVGYISYDTIRFFEEIPDENTDEIGAPDTYFMFPSEILIFDHKKETVDIIVYNSDDKRLKDLESIIKTAKDYNYNLCKEKSIQYKSNFSKNEFCNIVKKAKEYIRAGDIFQVVPSQRISAVIDKKPLNIYRALRITNPSPYMYYLRLNDLYILGSSPETLIKLNEDIVTSNPIAGTRPRGITEKEDKILESELLSDEKELAEHIMLLDLARNDIGRVCEYGSVKVSKFLEIEKFSKVMHIISVVNGKLVTGMDAFDLIEATFPAGTVTGAPKIRAMEIIDELEPTRRGIYAGAIGYFGLNGNMDLCIAIRTIIIKDKLAYIQGGAGIVADSVPEREYIETLNKMSALKKALETSQ